MTLSKEQVDKYVDGGFNHCPFCGSSRICMVGDLQEVATDEVRCEVRCTICEKKWMDVYKLATIVEL